MKKVYLTFFSLVFSLIAFTGESFAFKPPSGNVFKKPEEQCQVNTFFYPRKNIPSGTYKRLAEFHFAALMKGVDVKLWVADVREKNKGRTEDADLTTYFEQDARGKWNLHHQNTVNHKDLHIDKGFEDSDRAQSLWRIIGDRVREDGQIEDAFQLDAGDQMYRKMYSAVDRRGLSIASPTGVSVLSGDVASTSFPPVFYTCGGQTKLIQLNAPMPFSDLTNQLKNKQHSI